MLAIVSLMIISFISLLCFRIYYARRDVSISFRCDDMYSKDNYSTVLCKLNNYFFENDKRREELKDNSLFFADGIKLFYDNLINKFYVEYRYKSILYKKGIVCIECDRGLIFIPEERKYIG